MQVAKWGNSLAIRIPRDVVQILGLKEGDDVTLHALDQRNVAIVTERQRRAEAIERIRRLARPLPKDYRFDREALHER